MVCNPLLASHLPLRDPQFFVCSYFWFGIHTASVPTTAETHTGRGAVLGKVHSGSIVRNAQMYTQRRKRTKHIRSSNLILDLYISLLMSLLQLVLL